MSETMVSHKRRRSDRQFIKTFYSCERPCKKSRTIPSFTFNNPQQGIWSPNSFNANFNTNLDNNQLKHMLNDIKLLCDKVTAIEHRLENIMNVISTKLCEQEQMYNNLRDYVGYDGDVKKSRNECTYIT